MTLNEQQEKLAKYEELLEEAEYRLQGIKDAIEEIRQEEIEED